ncbi:hypothetical protein ACPVPU_07200 [Sphingomonas sp. CJ99]
MFRINSSGATGDGRFKESPSPATKLSAAWLNAVQDELVNLVTRAEGGGAALNPGDSAQMVAAINAMIDRRISGLIGEPDGQTIRLGSVLIKTVNQFGSYAEGSYYVPFITPFPSLCESAIAVPLNASGNTSMDLFASVRGWSAEGVNVSLSTEASSANASGLVVWARGR